MHHSATLQQKQNNDSPHNFSYSFLTGVVKGRALQDGVSQGSPGVVSGCPQWQPVHQMLIKEIVNGELFNHTNKGRKVSGSTVRPVVQCKTHDMCTYKQISTINSLTLRAVLLQIIVT